MGKQFCFSVVLKGAAVALPFACAPLAFADGKFGGTLGVTSDYVAYGLSQTRGGAAIQADAHYQYSFAEEKAGLFAGAFASTLNPNRYNNADKELDGYIGATWRMDGGSTATFTATHYSYPGDSNRRRYDYDELSLTWGVLDQRLFGTVAWSPNIQNYGGNATPRCCREVSFEVTAHQPLAHRFTLIAGVGYAELAGVAGYGYWNAGVSRMLWDMELNLSYIGTQERAEYLFSEAVAGPRWAASAFWRFGGR